MVLVETSNFLDGKIAKEKNIKTLTFLEEFVYQDGKFGRKMQGKARGNDGTEGVLSLNKTNQKKCAELTNSNDSKAWVNKTFEIVVVPQSVEGKIHDVILITGIATGKL